MDFLLAPMPAAQLLAAARTGDKLQLLADGDKPVLGWRDRVLRALAHSPLAGAPAIAQGGALVVCIGSPHVVCWNADASKYGYIDAIDYVAANRFVLQPLHHSGRVTLERQHAARAALHDRLMAAINELNQAHSAVARALPPDELATQLMAAVASAATHYTYATPLPGIGLQPPDTYTTSKTTKAER